MNKKSLLVALATFALVSCNNSGNMPKITEDRAKELANQIMDRQENPQVFELPKNFVYTYSTQEQDDVLDPNAKYNNNYFTKTVTKLNLEKLSYYSYYKEVTPESGTIERTTYEFFDNAKRTRYELINTNGYKYRHDIECTIDDAREYFAGIQTAFENIMTWHENDSFYDYKPFALFSYENELNSYIARREELKDEKDQYCNIFVGSSGPKALQTKVNAKTKSSTFDGYSGYLTINMSTTIKNDLFSSCTTESHSKRNWEENKKFYKNIDTKTSTTVTYGNAHISIPNIGGYIVKDSK